ncbi:signal recognition particle receptor subunit beta [Cryptosporidium felis]|nr:signal recognition particle receptor subunit beta [Cryptosporidium felis]
MLLNVLFYIIIGILGASLIHSLKFINLSVNFFHFVFNSLIKSIENAKNQVKYLLIIGPSGSGKTILFYKVKKSTVTNTTTSIIPNSTILVNNVYLIDIPGNRKAINEYILKYINNARSFILVIDSGDKPTFKEAAEILLFVMNNVENSSHNNSKFNTSRIKVLILCNKSDLNSSRNTTYIKEELERNIALNTRGFEPNFYSSKFYDAGKPFSLENVKLLDIRFKEISLKYEDIDLNVELDLS